MDSMTRRLALAAACAIGFAGAAAAQPYPNRPITMVVPFAAGGPSDTIGRLLADHMGRTLGQQIVVENVAGAGGTAGAARVAAAAPDGYTILIHHVALKAAPALYNNLRYETATAFEMLGAVNTGPMVLVGKSGLPANNAAEFFAWAERRAIRRPSPMPASAPTRISAPCCSARRWASSRPWWPIAAPARP